MNTDRITCELTPAEARGAHLPRRAPQPPDAATLVKQAASGQQRAWPLLVGRFEATIRAVARRHGLNAADVGEVAQRTWLRLVLHIERVNNGAALGGWLVTTARRECLSVLHANRREIPLEELPNADEPTEPATEERVLERERHRALRRALDATPPHQRRVIELMLDHPQLSYEEVSAARGIPTGSIGPTRQRCLARLRANRELAGVCRPSAPPRRRRLAPGHDLGLRVHALMITPAAAASSAH